MAGFTGEYPSEWKSETSKAERQKKEKPKKDLSITVVKEIHDFQFFSNPERLRELIKEILTMQNNLKKIPEELKDEYNALI